MYCLLYRFSVPQHGRLHPRRHHVAVDGRGGGRGHEEGPAGGSPRDHFRLGARARDGGDHGQVGGKIFFEFFPSFCGLLRYVSLFFGAGDGGDHG